MDIIATGTDIKPVEVIIFLRDVKSEIYYEQMKGRGVRTINPTDLRQVTQDAIVKDKFILIDAVGVTESAKSASQPLERKRTVAFDALMDRVAAASYKRLDRARVRDASPERLLTDIVALVRFALGQNETLEPFAVDVERRFNLWLGREQKAGRVYGDGQRAWLDLIKAHVAANAEITLDDLQHAPAMGDQGGRLGEGVRRAGKIESSAGRVEKSPGIRRRPAYLDDATLRQFGQLLKNAPQLRPVGAGISKHPHDLRLPVRRDLTIAGKGGQNLLVPEILAPCLELLRRPASLLAEPCQCVPEAMRVEAGQADRLECLSKNPPD